MVNVYLQGIEPFDLLEGVHVSRHQIEDYGGGIIAPSNSLILLNILYHVRLNTYTF